MKTKAIKMYDTIHHYTELKDLLEEHEPDFLKRFNADEMIALEHVLDFENYEFLVVNYDHVITMHDNDVIAIDTMKQFKAATLEFIKGDN